MNNKNRQYKPPLSIHVDHEAVVTPIATDDVRYDLRPFETVDDALIEQAVSWADDLTRVEHTDCVNSLVATLWPDLYEEHGGWRAALDIWVQAERERERERQRRREATLQQREERLAELDGTLEGHPITPFKEDVYEAVENVNVTEIARYYASDAYDTDPNQPRPQFDPGWRHSESGQSCFVDEQANTFGDSKVNAGGGPAKLMALATGIISDADADLDGEDYWAAIDELRSAGYDIPVWIPEAGSDRADGGTYDQMPFWAIRKAAVALKICPEDAFIDWEGEDGTYEGFPGYETYNETLEAIEDAGLRHGRDSISPEEGPDSEDQNEKDASSNTASADSPASQLDQAHLHEKNRLLLAKVDQLESELDEKTDRIDTLEAEIECLQREFETVRSERDHLESALEDGVLNQDSEQQTEEDPADDRSPLDRARQLVSFDQ